VTIVVDASAIAAAIFREPEAPAILARIAGRSLAAPNLLGYEIANVCAMKIRRNPVDAAKLLTQLGEFAELDIALISVSPDAAGALAAETGMTAYGASYLWLARALDAELVTLDRRLAAAARPPRTPA
jgi:predicted nucleic acid-binding protein